MTDQPHADHEDDLHMDLLAHMACHPFNQSAVQTVNPLHYSFPLHPHGSYAIPYALSQEIAPLAERADYLQGFWLDGELTTLTDDGEVLIPERMLLAARAIQANSVAIFAELHKPSLKSIRGKANKLAASARMHANIDVGVEPVQVWAMLVLCQYVAWFDRLTLVLKAFSIQAAKVVTAKSVGTGWKEQDQAIFNEAVNLGLADQLRPLLNPIADLLESCADVAEEAGHNTCWQHPDLASYCDRLDAYRWRHANTSALPQDDESLAEVKLLIQDWFSSMADHSNIESRLRVWQNSPFPVLIGGVQAVLHTVNPTWQGQLDHYAAVRDIATEGLSSIEAKCLVLLRQLFVTKQRNIDGDELWRLQTRLGEVVEALRRDAPQWVEHQRLRNQAEKVAPLLHATAKRKEKARELGRFEPWGWAKEKWREFALQRWGCVPKTSITQMVSQIRNQHTPEEVQKKQRANAEWPDVFAPASTTDEKGREFATGIPSQNIVREAIKELCPVPARSKVGRPKANS